MAETHHPNYKKIYFILLGLLAISVAGPFLGVAWVTLLTAFGIAVVKANMVVQNFMHLKWERRIVKYVLAVSLALMVLFYGAVAPDVQKHDGRNWVNEAAKAAVARGIPGPHHEGAAAHGGTEPPAQAHEPQAAPAEQRAAFDPAATFASTCTTCHGVAGGGDGPAAAALNPKPANFSDPAFWSSRGDAELIKAILEGGAAVGRSAAMPAWGSLFDQEKATAMVAYLHTLRKK
jgi:caa(3)-type oxidase subunit IV